MWAGPVTLAISIWGSSLMLVTLTSIGKSVAYMPYAEATRALEQEAQMHSTAARSASPCRLSLQPGVGAARSSGPPGKYRSSCRGCWPSTYTAGRGGLLPGHVPAISEFLSCFSASHLQLCSVEIHWATGRFVFIPVYCDVDCLFSYEYMYFVKILRSTPC